jgi:hypothetical protein
VDRCALFVDAGYALSDGALAVHGTRHRDSVSWDYAGLLKLLAELARDRTGLPVLRCYWYEATVDSRRTPEHETLADIPGVKLRLGKVRPGRREGVETEIRRDLTALARNKAVTDVLIVSAEEDLSQVISDVQDQGIKVAILHISGDGDETASRALRQECDDVIQISAQHLRPYVDLIPGAEPTSRDGAASRYAASTVSGGHVSAGSASGGGVAGGASSVPPQREPATAGTASSSLYPAPVAADYSRVSPQGGSAPSANEPAGQGVGGQGSRSPMAGSPAMASSGGSMGPGLGGDNGARGNGSGNMGSGNMGSGNMGSGNMGSGNMGPGGQPVLSRPDDQSSRLPAHQQYQGSDAMRGPGPQGQLNSPGQPGMTQPGLGGNGLGGNGLGGNGLSGNGLGQGPLPPSGPPTGPQSGLPLGGPQQNGPGRGGPPQGPADVGHGGASSQPGLGGFPSNGMPQNGMPGNGMPGNGMPGNGLSHLGLPPGGMSQNGLPQNGLPGNGMPPGGMSQNGMGQNGLPGNGMPGNGLPQNGMSQNGLSGNGLPGNGLPGNGLPQNGLPGNGLPPSGFGQHSLSSGSGNELPRGGGLGQHAQTGPPQHSQGGPPPQNGLPPGGSSGGPAALERPAPLDRPPALPPPRQLPAGPGAGSSYQPGVNAPYGGQPQQPPAAPAGQYGGGYGSTVPPGSNYPAPTSGPYDVQHLPSSGPPALPQSSMSQSMSQSSMPQPIAISLADAVQAAHAEGFGFGEAVARDAPALWLEAVLARKPRMPSDLEARLLQGSALPIDSLLHDEVRHALRRGFWDALERSRR